MLFGCQVGCGHGSSSSAEVAPPEVPAQLNSPLTGARTISWTQFQAYLQANQLSTLSQTQIQQNFLQSSSQVGLDAMAVSDFISSHPNSNLLNDTLPPEQSLYTTFTNSNGVSQTVRLLPNENRIYNIARALSWHKTRHPLPTPSLTPTGAQAPAGESTLTPTDGVTGATTSSTGCQATALPFFLQAIDWPLKHFVPCVRTQSIRGTCSAFATVTAVEAKIAADQQTPQQIFADPIPISQMSPVPAPGASQPQGPYNFSPFIVLSEQGLYNQGELFWPSNDYYSDGYNSIGYFQNSQTGGYRIPFSTMWDYNPSPNRTVDQQQYVGSCTGYSEYCSDTSHQGSLVCAQEPGSLYECGYLTQISNSSVGVQIVQYDELWNPSDITDSMSSLKTSLSAGLPVVMEFMATDTFLNMVNGFVYPPGATETNIGNHALALVGYIPNEQGQLGTLYTQYLPQSMTRAQYVAISSVPYPVQTSNEDYFIAQNSWGESSGDAGYVYIPESYISKHATALIVVQSLNLKQ